jgi:hypothetical protein
MTSPIKKATLQQALDALTFSVLAGFRHLGGMRWTDWHEATRARRGKLSTGTFSLVVRRLTAAGRVRIDKDGCYQVVFDMGEEAVADNSRTPATTLITSENSLPASENALSNAGTSDAAKTKPSAAVFLEAFCEAEAEIAKLRAENKQLLDWIMGDADALTVLQSIYQSPESSQHTKIKAASHALAFERPKLTASIGVMLDFRDRVRQARLKATAKLIEHIPEPTIEAAS